jgi:hypothetical protein
MLHPSVDFSSLGPMFSPEATSGVLTTTTVGAGLLMAWRASSGSVPHVTACQSDGLGAMEIAPDSTQRSLSRLAWAPIGWPAVEAVEVFGAAGPG